MNLDGKLILTIVVVTHTTIIAAICVHRQVQTCISRKRITRCSIVYVHFRVYVVMCNIVIINISSVLVEQVLAHE